MDELDHPLTPELAEAAMIGFEDRELLPSLEALDEAGLDELRFGVIRLNELGIVVAYNSLESISAGLAAERVKGRRFFEAVAPCMNNFMVATRFEAEPTLDVTIDYVLTLRMRPTPARLRLLQSPSFPNSYVLVQRT